MVITSAWAHQILTHVLRELIWARFPDLEILGFVSIEKLTKKEGKKAEGLSGKVV